LFYDVLESRYLIFLAQVYSQFLRHRVLNSGPVGYRAFGEWVHHGGLDFRNNPTGEPKKEYCKYFCNDRLLLVINC